MPLLARIFVTFAFAFALCLATGVRAVASPLDSGAWYQVAHMSDSDNGMFDGNGNLQPGYSFGTAIAGSETTQTDDFARPFTEFVGMKMLFITGNQEIWAMADYAEIKGLINAFSGTFAVNIAFESRLGGVEMSRNGNILSRSGFPEDPWITIEGDHTAGVNNSTIIWGEFNWTDGNPVAGHEAIKNLNGGVNVFVQLQAVPAPAAAALIPGALVLLGGLRRAGRHAA
jgi:hypothetical protein